MRIQDTPRAATTPTPPPTSGERAISVQYPPSGEYSVRADARQKAGFGLGTVSGVASGLVLGAVALAGVGLIAKKVVPTNVLLGSLAGRVGIVGGAALGALGGAALGHYFLDRAFADKKAQSSLRFDAESRPPLPPASDVPSVKLSTVSGKPILGISGSSIGQVVKVTNLELAGVSTSTRTTINDRGEPVISLGNVSGSETTIEEQLKVVPGATTNAMGLGRVLYNTEGYKSMSDALEAYDGHHSAAIVREGEKYYIADFDAEDYAAMSVPGNAILIGDDRVKMIMANGNMYAPSSLSPTNRDGTKSTAKMFMFAQGQDNDESIPQSVHALKDHAIGWYDTNGNGRERGPFDGTQLRIGDALNNDPANYTYLTGFSDRQEAVTAMVKEKGNQALIQRGSRYYLTETSSTRSLEDTIDQSRRTGFIHGLRTTPDSKEVQLIEDVGGLYAPQGDWWVRVREE